MSRYSSITLSKIGLVGEYLTGVFSARLTQRSSEADYTEAFFARQRSRRTDPLFKECGRIAYSDNTKWNIYSTTY